MQASPLRIATLLLAFFLHIGTARAADINVLSVLGMRSVLEEIKPAFEHSTGHRIALSLTTSGDLLKRVDAGETADVVIMPERAMARLVKAGKAAPHDVVIIAHSNMGLAVRKGAAVPDISSPEALKRVLLSARSITYPNPEHGAASGIHFATVLERMGIAHEVKAKTVFLPKPGPVGILVAKGDAEVAIHQLQELMPVPGIEIVGPLPRELQDTLIFTAAVMAAAGNVTASRALVDFLRGPEVARVFRQKGMEPR